MNLKNTYYLVRHGECDSNITNTSDHQGDPTNHLTEKGKSQVEACTQNLSSKGVIFEKIISSPFPRTIETAEILLQYLAIHDKNILHTPLLQEMNHGTHSQGEVIISQQEKDSAYEEMHYYHGDGECYWDVRARMLRLIEQLENSYSNKTLILVTHGTPVWMFYSAAHDLNEEQTLAFKRERKITTGFFIPNAIPFIIN